MGQGPCFGAVREKGGDSSNVEADFEIEREVGCVEEVAELATS